MRSKRKSFKPRKKGGRANADVSLNITAMADIFVVLLVFLLKSFASGSMVVSTTAELDLPMATNQSEAVEAMKVEISKDHLVVEGESILDLKDFKFPSDDLLPVGISKKLFEVLKAKKGEELTENLNSNKVIILADKGTPYASLKVILTSAAGSGLTDFKMAVREMQ